MRNQQCFVANLSCSHANNVEVQVCNIVVGDKLSRSGTVYEAKKSECSHQFFNLVVMLLLSSRSCREKATVAKRTQDAQPTDLLCHRVRANLSFLPSPIKLTFVFC